MAAAAYHLEEEQFWKCPKHPTKRRRNGICSTCLRDRLVSLCPNCGGVRPCPCIKRIEDFAMMITRSRSARVGATCETRRSDVVSTSPNSKAKFWQAAVERWWRSPEELALNYPDLRTIAPNPTANSTSTNPASIYPLNSTTNPTPNTPSPFSLPRLTTANSPAMHAGKRETCNANKYAHLVLRNIENPSDITLWNGLMSAYAKKFMFSEALSLFDSLLQFPDLKPDSYTYPTLLKACGGLRRIDFGEKIHTQLIKSGFMSDVVIASSLMGMYAKCGLFASAVKVFDEMSSRDLACWNNVVSCYFQSGQFEKALEYFERMRSIGLRLDSVSFTTAISSCARLLDLERGAQIHEEVLRSGIVIDSYVSAALVDMYGKCGCLERAKEVFNESKDKSLVCWNAMIGGYSQIGDSKSCIELFVRMNEEKIRPCSTTISNVIVACAKSAQWHHGRFIHGYIIRNNVLRDIFVESSLVDFYFKCGSIVLAEKVFRLMPKSNIVAWNVMISGYVSAGFYLKALGIYDEMKVAGIRPDAITLTSALAASSQLASLERGREFHDYINQNRLNSHEIVMGALLDMYAKCGAVEEAVSVFNQLPKRDLVSWTSMIVAYGSHGRAVEALKLFDEMLQSQVRPDRVTFLAVISACSHGGLVEEGRRFFKLMTNEYKIKPTTAEYSCLIDLLSRAGRLQEAYEILQNNQDIKEDVDLLSTLFAACHLHGELELGKKIAKLLIEKDLDDPSTYVVLGKMYAADKKWDEAQKIRFKMKKLGLRKNPGYSWIEIDKKIQSFLSEDATFAQAESVYECISLLYSHMEENESEAVGILS